MKITYSIHQFFPHYFTGTERYLLNLSKMMQKFGHEVKIFTYQPQLFEDKFIKKENEILVREYQYENLIVSSLKLVKEDPYLSFSMDNKIISLFFEKVFKSSPPQILHITHPMRLGGIFNAAKKLGIKIVMTLTDYWLLCGKVILLRNNDQICFSPEQGQACKKFCYQNLKKEIIKQRLLKAKEMFENSDAIIFSNKFIYRIFKANNFKNKNIFIIPHGDNIFSAQNTIIKNNKNKNNQFIIASLGTIQKHKGIHLLVSAFKKIPYKNILLFIFGDPKIGGSEYFYYLRKIIGNDKRIIFKGEYKEGDLKKILRNIDVVVQPSIWFETYPLVCVHALKNGVPIIVPRPSGAEHLVKENKNGFTFKIGNVESLKLALLKAFKKRLKNNFHIFYDYSIEEEAFATEQVYKFILKK